jgi:3-oxoacyl-[acyl-carrier protein] reductase
MKKYKAGRIVNFSTIAVPISLEGESVYAASKSAVESFTKSFSKEVADFGITVNIVGPNPIKTDLIKNVDNTKLQNVINMQTIKRYGKFGDILNIVNFYLNESSDMITGQKIYLGGL